MYFNTPLKYYTIDSKEDKGLDHILMTVLTSEKKCKEARYHLMSNLLKLSGQLNRSSIFYKRFICQNELFQYFPVKQMNKVNANKFNALNIQQRVQDLDIDF